MKSLISLCLIFLLTSFIIQKEEGTKYVFKEIGWQIVLPSDFNVINSVANSIDIEEAKKNSERPLSKTLISAFKNQNFLIASLTLPDNKPGNSGDEAAQKAFNNSYKEMAKSKDIKIDSSTSTKILDGVRFKKFKLTQIKNGKIVNSFVSLASSYKSYDFIISYMYFDKYTSDEIESLLINSKFAK